MGKLTPFSTYVAQSRSRGRDNILLLRNVNERLFTKHPNDHLRHEDAQLERPDETKAN